MSWTGTVRCGNCWDEGHNKRTCPTLKKAFEEDPNSWEGRKWARMQQEKKQAGPRLCSYCQESGHNRRTCRPLAVDRDCATVVQGEYFDRTQKWLEEAGVGIGTLVSWRIGWRADSRSVVGMVKALRHHDISFQARAQSHEGSFIHAMSLDGQHGRWLRPSVDSGLSNDSGFQVEEVVAPLPSAVVKAQLQKEAENIGLWRGQLVGGVKQMFDSSQIASPEAIAHVLHKEYFGAPEEEQESA